MFQPRGRQSSRNGRTSVFRRQKRPSLLKQTRRRRVSPLRNSAGTGCRLDRARLAWRRRGLSARLSSTGSLQWRFGYRIVSFRTCSGYGTAIFGGTRACRRGASSKKPEKPQCGTDGPLSRRRRRYGPGLDRLCAHGDVEDARGRSLVADAHVAAGLFSDGLIAADKQLDVVAEARAGSLASFALSGQQIGGCAQSRDQVWRAL